MGEAASFVRTQSQQVAQVVSNWSSLLDRRLGVQVDDSLDVELVAKEEDIDQLKVMAILFYSKTMNPQFLHHLGHLLLRHLRRLRS